MDKISNMNFDINNMKEILKMADSLSKNSMPVKQNPSRYYKSNIVSSSSQ